MYIFLEKKASLFANSADPDQMPHSAASDLGLHCLPITFKRYPEYNGLIAEQTCCIQTHIYRLYRKK